MTISRRCQMTALALLVCAIGVVGTAPGQDMPTVLRGSKVDLVRAVEAALKTMPDAKLIEVDLERAGGDVVWELDLLAGDKLMKAQVDRLSGKVLKTWDASAEESDEVGEAQRAVGSTKVDWRSAIETAQRAQPGGMLYHLELELEDGAPVYTVEALMDGQRVEVEVDGVLGKPHANERREVDNEDEGAEDERDEHEAAEERHERGDHGMHRQGQREFTESFNVESREFASVGRNPFFILEPGYQLVLEGQEGQHKIMLTVTVLDETHKVGNVETRVVEERETVDGALMEVSRNYFAVCTRTNDVFYFGETTDEYRDGKIVGHEGAWEAGRDGARPGLMMPGTPLLGARFYQEVAPKVAMDRAEIVELNTSFNTPAGSFSHCLKVLETTPLERGAREYKLYAPGVGLIQDEDLKLTTIKRP
jgi:uncharacterized membrane protein YkoI